MTIYTDSSALLKRYVDEDDSELGAARRLGTAVTFLTFDLRQGQAARGLGLRVVGA